MSRDFGWVGRQDSRRDKSGNTRNFGSSTRSGNNWTLLQGNFGSSKRSSNNWSLLQGNFNSNRGILATGGFWQQGSSGNKGVLATRGFWYKEALAATRGFQYKGTFGSNKELLHSPILNQGNSGTRGFCHKGCHKGFCHKATKSLCRPLFLEY